MKILISKMTSSNRVHFEILHIHERNSIMHHCFNLNEKKELKYQIKSQRLEKNNYKKFKKQYSNQRKSEGKRVRQNSCARWMHYANSISSSSGS